MTGCCPDYGGTDGFRYRAVPRHRTATGWTHRRSGSLQVRIPRDRTAQLTGSPGVVRGYPASGCPSLTHP